MARWSAATCHRRDVSRLYVVCKNPCQLPSEGRSSEPSRHPSRRVRPLPGGRSRHELSRAQATTLTSVIAASPSPVDGVHMREGWTKDHAR